MYLGLHLIARLRTQGSGRLHHNWLDESLNTSLKLACRNASQMAFEVTVSHRIGFAVKSSVAVRTSSPALQTYIEVARCNDDISWCDEMA